MAIRINGTNTTANPGITGADADTGLQFGTDEVKVVTGGTERLFVDSNGRVGLGTSSPTAALDIKHNSASTHLRLTELTSGNYSAFGVDTSDNLRIYVNNSERIRIDSSGNVGIGTTSPRGNLHIDGAASAPRIDLTNTATGSASTDGATISVDGSTGALNIIQRESEPIQFYTAATEAARIDGGRLLVGTSTVIQTSSNSLIQTASPTGGYYIAARNDTSVTTGNALGGMRFYGNDDDGNYDECGRIECAGDGNHSSTSKPSRLGFYTTASGESSTTERMRIQQNGTVLIGKTSDTFGAVGTRINANGVMTITAVSNELANFNRLTTDGVLLYFTQDSATEGSISVSGSTVSYNGAHLSRWSQLPSGAERTEILRGTVLSNIDEMCEWGEEENEQLNRMKVSDIEGDKNVSGVFQAWDDDDDTYTNDFY